MRFLFIFLIFSLSLPIAYATAESWRTCDIDEPCMLGDHVYNDTWSPYTNRICTINITYPNGTSAVSDANMDNNSLGRGFHNYSYTPPVEGFYAVEMYCTNAVDTGRLDRSFVAKIAGESVWLYSNRTTLNYFDKVVGGDILSNSQLFFLVLVAVCMNIGFKTKGRASMPFFLFSALTFAIWGIYIALTTPFPVIGTEVGLTDMGLINEFALFTMLGLSGIIFFYTGLGAYRSKA